MEIILNTVNSLGNNIIILVALLCSFFLSPPFASLVFYGAGHYFCTMSIQYFYNYIV